jgi:formamidopyrimidine-DNA glycosylase
MPELPEIHCFAADLQREVVGHTISQVQVLQPKCLNLPVEVFQSSTVGAEILTVRPHGKWLIVELSRGWLLLNLGMGGEILLTNRDNLPEKHRLIVDLGADTCLAINFWWFGFAHWAEDLAHHAMTARLGPDFMSLSASEFQELLVHRRGAIKNLLLDQKRVAGIGNVYVQDPLFRAGIHPLRKANKLSAPEIQDLWLSLRQTLEESIALGGSQWEQNLYGERGGWDHSHFLVAYREDRPCPTCGSVIAKIKTGSTSSYICPTCQAPDPNIG